MARRRFSAKCRADAVRRVGESKRSIRAVAHELGVAQGTLSRWVNESPALPPTGAARDAFRERLVHLCAHLGLAMSVDASAILFSPDFPMWIRVEVHAGDGIASLVGVVRTVGLPGDRSDYHELISLLWAAVLRRANIASARLVDVDHPTIEGELWGRYLFFGDQPTPTFVDVANPDYEMIERLLYASRLAAMAFSRLYVESGGQSGRETCGGKRGAQWTRRVSKALRLKSGHVSELANQRNYPNWCYYRRGDLGVTAFRLRTNPLALLPHGSKHPGYVVAGEHSTLVRTGALRNAIDNGVLVRVRKLLEIDGVKNTGDLKDLGHPLQFLLIPIDSHLICFSPRAITALRSEGGALVFKHTEERLRRRHQCEAALLNAAVRFSWAARLDDDLFEALVLELLNRDPSVIRARRVGAARAADGGRDIIAQWIQAPALWQKATKEKAWVHRNVVVQCKASTRAVNRDMVGDVTGTVEMHGYDGYLLVAPRVTPQVVDYLSVVPAKRKIWAEWWTQAEIEDRLRRDIDIAERYPTLLSVVRA